MREEDTIYKLVMFLTMITFGLGVWAGTNYEKSKMSQLTYPKGDYISKRLTGKLVKRIENKYGKPTTAVLLEAAYTAWCVNQTSTTVDAYIVTSGMIESVMHGEAKDLYSLIHTPGKFMGCWGKDGKTQVFDVNKDYVEFYQSLDLLFNEAKGRIPLASGVYNEECE